jgi:hypothetical protein
MNCNEAQHELALAAGQDLNPQDQDGLNRHLAVCPECRAHWRNLQDSTDVLQQASAGAEHPGPSLWPDIEARLKARKPRVVESERATPAGWLPVIAMALATAATIAFALSTPVFDLDSSSMARSQRNTFHHGNLVVPASSYYNELIPVDPDTNPMEGRFPRTWNSPQVTPVLDPATRSF